MHGIPTPQHPLGRLATQMGSTTEINGVTAHGLCYSHLQQRTGSQCPMVQHMSRLDP